MLRTTTLTFNPFKISLSNQGNQGDSGRRYSRDPSRWPHGIKKRKQQQQQKDPGIFRKIPEIPSGSTSPTIGIRKGNDNWRFRNIYPTDRQIQEILHQGFISPWNQRKTRIRRFNMKIQERDSRDRSRLEIFLPGALCTSSLSGESMRRGVS